MLLSLMVEVDDVVEEIVVLSLGGIAIARKLAPAPVDEFSGKADAAEVLELIATVVVVAVSRVLPVEMEETTVVPNDCRLNVSAITINAMTMKK